MKKLTAALAALVLALALAAPVAADRAYIDACPNIDGFQSRVPGNMTVVIARDGSTWYCVPKK